MAIQIREIKLKHPEINNKTKQYKTVFQWPCFQKIKKYKYAANYDKGQIVSILIILWQKKCLWENNRKEKTT